ncbi:MAG TPA: HD domain-containing phosphohydrolase [Ramlibacter sp.]|uniref:HD domain-containing phosphohydrolase n=1 Tax=Ramlibacter sp. TaxID=1917967 RepID=UPI002C8C91A9|nr:HD domain-containing phosphohydrolase [Ramlibacter sp.]HVZ43794.1 HD domain-containing phosphohydrolase [Ramlibacter sp.]
MAEGAPTGPLRLAEVLGTLSLATDLANAQPSEDGLRIALLASRLAVDEPASVRHEVFWTGLLRYLGCNGFAVEDAAYASGDDVGLRAAFIPIDFGRPQEFIGAVLRDVGKGAPPLQRAAGVLKLLADPGAGKAHAHAQCDAAVHCGKRLGMPEGVLRALSQADERYDGRGVPLGLTGGALSLAQRYVEAARIGVVYNALGGPSRAAAELRRRSGGHLDPTIVARFEADAPALCTGLDQSSVWDDFLACEPGVWLVDEQGLGRLFEAFALMADLKSGYFSGHSTGVAALARAAALAQGLRPEDADLLAHAALLHDIGRVAVPTGLWDKPAPLTASEWERVHLHSYYTDRVLRRSPALARHADIAGRAHERADGSGYHRGERDSTAFVRLLAAADTYHACGEPRAYRPALDGAAARKVLLDEVARGRLDRAAVDAVLAAAGAQPAPAASLPAGLTERELEVLRLVVLGLSNKEIGKRLGISPRTVQHHTIHIYGKSGVKSRGGVALWAVEQGLFGAAPRP